MFTQITLGNHITKLRDHDRIAPKVESVLPNLLTVDTFPPLHSMYSHIDHPIEGVGFDLR